MTGRARPRSPRVLVVHDYLTQRGGAERVALSLLRAFPGAPMLTTIYNAESTYPEFAEHDVRTLWVDRVPAFRDDPRRALPFLAHAVGSAVISGFDAVVCSSSGWAHGVPTSAPKIVYCHTPARWLWETEDYLAGVPAAARPLIRAAFPVLRKWDRAAAASCATYLANSTTVQERIRRAYGCDAQVVFPPVSIDVDAPLEPVPGVAPGYLLTVSRARSYKHVELICEAVEQEPDLRLLVVGALPARRDGRAWSDRLQVVSGMTDGQMRWLYRHARALVAVSHEDFGLTPVEAYAFGTPAVLLRAGGYLDSSVEGRTCVFVDGLSVEELRGALERLRGTAFDRESIREHADAFSEVRFHEAVRRAVDATLERVRLGDDAAGVPAPSAVPGTRGEHVPRGEYSPSPVSPRSAPSPAAARVAGAVVAAVLPPSVPQPVAPAVPQPVAPAGSARVPGPGSPTPATRGAGRPRIAPPRARAAAQPVGPSPERVIDLTRSRVTAEAAPEQRAPGRSRPLEEQRD